MPKCGDDEECREKVIGKHQAAKAKEKGRPVPRNYALPEKHGRRYYGRGYIQLTHRTGYELASDKLKVDLVTDPDRALEPTLAATLIVRAMLEGWYGSERPLSYYLGPKREDWINARNNVNPWSDNKAITAEYAKDLNNCLRAKKQE